MRKKTMPDVRLLIEKALKPLKIPVSSEKHDLNDGDTEYIVYFVENEKNDIYADNKPHLRRSNISIYYVTLSKNNKLTKPDKIIAAMEKCGFKVTDRQIDLVNPVRIENLHATGWSGIRQEYALERFY